VTVDSPLLGGRQSRLWSALAAAATLIQIGTPIVALVGIILADEDSIIGLILTIYVCLLATGLLLLLAWQEHRYRRESRYAPAMIPMRKAFNCLADASWTLIQGNGSVEAFRARLEQSLGYLAEAFGLLTDHSCRASIKMIAVADDAMTPHDVRVVTLCRNVDQDPVYTGPDRIGNNTDFKQIFVENANCYFSNDLPGELKRGYQNSHWSERVIQERQFEYTATIVWPIGRSWALGNEERKREIIGFLCVDTLATGVFNKTYDVPLGAAFAQALHLALSRFRAEHARG
jgi:hypothetical protein